MRMHIVLEDELVAELDRRVGPRQRSAFITELIKRGIDDEQRWDDIEASLGALADTAHEWDEDPAAWVRAQRHGDQRRAG
jgi:metal-responsive CopG/Arc/MetJ family transcriptional regulator